MIRREHTVVSLRLTYKRSVLWWLFFFFSSRRRHTRYWRDWSSDVCSSDLGLPPDEDTALAFDGEEGDEEEEEEEEAPDEPPPDDEQLEEAPEDPNAHKRFWFEHATGAGKTVAALGFVEASRTGGVLILTHRRNLVDQFNGELRDRGYKDRITRALTAGQDPGNGPVTVETYQWFVRNAGSISSAYTVVICDEAHTALGEKTAAAIRQWTGPLFIGMTATRSEERRVGKECRSRWSPYH